MWYLRVVLQVVLLSLIALLGEAIVRVFSIPFPGPLFGMGLLFLALISGKLPVHWFEDGADVLIGDILLFFIPPAIGIMQYPELFGKTGALLLAVIIASMLILLWTIAFSTVFISRRKRKGGRRRG